MSLFFPCFDTILSASFICSFHLLMYSLWVPFIWHSVGSIISIGSFRVLPKSRKYGEYPVRECMVQLYANTNFFMWSFHLLLWSSGNVCRIEITFESKLSSMSSIFTIIFLCNTLILLDFIQYPIITYFWTITWTFSSPKSLILPVPPRWDIFLTRTWSNG